MCNVQVAVQYLQNTVYSVQCNTNLFGSSKLVYPFPVSQRRQAAVITYVGQEEVILNKCLTDPV